MTGSRLTHVGKAISEHAEDIALALGTITFGIGIGLAFGLAWSLVAVGALLVGYGVWITERRP